jgi:hypothetical protein
MRYVVIGMVWFCLAVAASAAGLTQRLRPPAPQALVAVLTILLVVAIRTGAGFRAWLRGMGWRPLVAFHLTRFVGLWFLVLQQRGELPAAWATPAGVGDVGVAILATGLLLVFARRDPPVALLLGWNALGLADILVVVVTAARSALADPASMSALTRLPLSLLLTFVVPVIIASHVWMLSRSRQLQPAT